MEREREKQRGKKSTFVNAVSNNKGVYIQLPRELSVVFKDKE